MDSSYEIVGKKNTQSLLINTPTHLHFSFNFWYTGKSYKLTMLYRKICFSAHLTTAIKYLSFLVFHFFQPISKLYEKYYFWYLFAWIPLTMCIFFSQIQVKVKGNNMVMVYEIYTFAPFGDYNASATNA